MKGQIVGGVLRKANRASAVDGLSNFLLIHAALKKMFLDGTACPTPVHL